MEQFNEGDTKKMNVNPSLKIPFGTPYPIIPRILESHPIFPALTATAVVPEDYMFQLWNTLEFVEETNEENAHFKYTIDANDLTLHHSFDLESFRSLLQFPTANSRPNTTEFTEIAEIPMMLEAVTSLGYQGELNQITDFKKNLLPKLWYTLFSIINSCLSPAQFGSDTMTRWSLANFCGVAFDLHYDFALIAWEQLQHQMKNKNQKKYIPFVRFLTLLLAQAISRQPQIAPIGEYTPSTINTYRFVQRSVGQDVPAKITKSLRRYISRDDPAYAQYRESLAALMEPENPQVPAHGAHRVASEGIESRKRKRKRGDRGGGSSRDNLKVRVKISKKKQRPESDLQLRDEPSPPPENQTTPPTITTTTPPPPITTQTPTPTITIQTPTPPITSQTPTQPIITPIGTFRITPRQATSSTTQPIDRMDREEVLDYLLAVYLSDEIRLSVHERAILTAIQSHKAHQEEQAEIAKLKQSQQNTQQQLEALTRRVLDLERTYFLAPRHPNCREDPDSQGPSEGENGGQGPTNEQSAAGNEGQEHTEHMEAEGSGQGPTEEVHLSEHIDIDSGEQQEVQSQRREENLQMVISANFPTPISIVKPSHVEVFDR